MSTATPDTPDHKIYCRRPKVWKFFLSVRVGTRFRKRKDNSKNATLVGNIGNIILVSCFIFFEKVARVSSKWLDMCGVVCEQSFDSYIWLGHFVCYNT